MKNRKDELMKFIIELKRKQKFRFARTLKESYPKKLKYLKSLTKFLDNKCNVGERIYCFLNNIEDVIYCPICKKNKVNYRPNGLGYYKHCSISCSRKDKKTQDKCKNTCLKKYGYEHNLSKGSPMRDKMVRNLIKKYGVTNISQLENVKNKKRKTFQKNHKEPHPLWGNTWYDIKIGNEEYKVQGYERYAIYDLIKKYGKENVIIRYKDIKSNIGEIIYFYNNKKYRYYPDFYIKSENKIIEVKSLFTLQNNLEITTLKMESCVNEGLKYEIHVYNNKGNIINEEEHIKEIFNRIKNKLDSCKK